MSNYVSFRPQDAVLPGYIRFSVTKSAFAKLGRTSDEALARLKAFSASKTLLAVKAKKDDWVEFFTAAGTYVCVPKDDGMLVIGFNENDLKKQNYVMKFGVCFQVSDGIIVQLNLTDHDLYIDVANGSQYGNHAFETKNVSRAVALICQKVTQSDAQAQAEIDGVEEEEYHPERRLDNLLQLSESYSILASQLEETKAQAIGKVAYHGIEAVEYDRVDRVCYQFGVSDLKEDTFKVGVQVEVEDSEGFTHAASITELVKEDTDAPATAVKLLFNDQIAIDQFDQQGWFGLSFSTVNKDVQLAANEKIRTGEAAAKYMDNVLGRHTTAGFENKDLRAVKEKLQQKKYPPNKSQMDAICAGINTKDVFLVMGPPGTGKTTVILEWVKYFVTQEHKRVLVSSQNNKAVDNVLARIAEEPDIDIIRVGSEAKLQSEVIPFMFENKVASLRRSIAEDTDAKCRQLDALNKEWQAFGERMEEIRRLYVQLTLAHTRLQEKLKTELLPHYRLLRTTQKSLDGHEMHKKALYALMQKLAEQLLKHENATGLSRFFTGFGYKKKSAQMKEYLSQWDALMQTEQQLKERYLQERQTYLQHYLRLLSNDYREYNDKRHAYQADFARLSVKPARDEADIWDLFRDARAVPLRSADDCTAQQQAILSAQARLAKLRRTLVAWKEDMESKQNYALNEIVLESVDLVGATCIGINSQKRFANLDFDVTIIDEAGQIQVHNALVPMSVSNKLIMLGDHKQIPPTADKELVKLCEQNDVDPSLLSMSLFEKMYNDLPDSNKMMLDTQYRMPAEIADTISEWFYDGEYYSPDFKRNLESQISKLSDKPYVIIDTSGEKGRFETPVPKAGSYNQMETDIIADIIRHIASEPDADLKEIGVISAYKSQVKRIKATLNTFLPKAVTNEMVATLDSYQGQERDIIFYSFTKTSTIDEEERRIGFLNELRRLNVAMTRCKKMLVLVGDMEFLGSCDHCDKDENGYEIYKQSEREFGDFIRKMLEDVRGGRGELIPYREFMKKWKEGND